MCLCSVFMYVPNRNCWMCTCCDSTRSSADFLLDPEFIYYDKTRTWERKPKPKCQHEAVTLEDKNPLKFRCTECSEDLDLDLDMHYQVKLRFFDGTFKTVHEGKPSARPQVAWGLNSTYIITPMETIETNPLAKVMPGVNAQTYRDNRTSQRQAKLDDILKQLDRDFKKESKATWHWQVDEWIFDELRRRGFKVENKSMNHHIISWE